MHIEATTQAPTDTGADTVAVPVFDGEGVAHDFEDGFLGSLVERGEAETSIGSVAVTHGGKLRFIIYGLGKRDDLTPEKARRAAAAVETKARSLGCGTPCIETGRAHA